MREVIFFFLKKRGSSFYVQYVRTVGVESKRYFYSGHSRLYLYIYISISISILKEWDLKGVDIITQPKITQPKTNKTNKTNKYKIKIHSDDENIKISCSVSPDCESGCGGTFWE